LGLLDVLQDPHIGLDDIDYIVDVLSVLIDEFFLVLQDHLDQVLMVTANLVNIVGVFGLETSVSLQGHLA